MSIIGLIVSIVLIPTYLRRYKAVKNWSCAECMKQIGNTNDSIQLYAKLYPRLNYDGRFLSYYGNLLIEDSKYLYAIEVLEKAKKLCPCPQLFENLGVAYMNYFATADFQQNIANEEHPPKSPLKGGINLPKPHLKSEARRIGGDYLSRDDCINKAINYWVLASNILPWRLTPKYYLADLFYQLDDTNEAIKYARLVVNTPMKKWTDWGKEFKLKSQKMLIAMGEKCDDPGLIVFDINDKKTWNEGAW